MFVPVQNIQEYIGRPRRRLTKLNQSSISLETWQSLLLRQFLSNVTALCPNWHSDSQYVHSLSCASCYCVCQSYPIYSVPESTTSKSILCHQTVDQIPECYIMDCHFPHRHPTDWVSQRVFRIWLDTSSEASGHSTWQIPISELFVNINSTFWDIHMCPWRLHVKRLQLWLHSKSYSKKLYYFDAKLHLLLPSFQKKQIWTSASLWKPLRLKTPFCAPKTHSNY